MLFEQQINQETIILIPGQISKHLLNQQSKQNQTFQIFKHLKKRKYWMTTIIFWKWYIILLYSFNV